MDTYVYIQQDMSVSNDCACLKYIRGSSTPVPAHAPWLYARKWTKRNPRDWLLGINPLISQMSFPPPLSIPLPPNSNILRPISTTSQQPIFLPLILLLPNHTRHLNFLL